ncbi:MAG: glycosyltransferase family 4 protein [Candidatus Methanosuratincola petrocarbonis]
MKRKKILLVHFNRSPPITGGEYVYLKIYQALSKEYVVNNVSITALILKYFPKHASQRALAKFLLEPAFVLYPLLLKNSYDLIFTSWSDNVPFFGDVVYAQPLAGDVLPNIKLKISDHGRTLLNVVDYLGTGMTWPWRRLFGKFSLKYHYCIANSKSTKAYLLKKYNKKSIVIYPPLKIENKNVDLSKKERLVLSIGNIIPEKRFHLIGKIGPKMPDVKFILIGGLLKNGKPVLDYIENSFEKVGLSDNFHYLGYVSEDVKKEYLEKASVVFHPAKNESFGLALVEGMAAGAVPVAHASGGPLEFIDEKWLFNDDSKIEEKIRSALDEGESTRREMMEKVRMFDEERFSSSILNFCSIIIKNKKIKKATSFE